MTLPRPALIPLLAACLLSGCMSAEARLKAELDAANYCETADDCEQIGSKCPFDCYVYAHKDEAAAMKAKLDAFPSTCEYGCIQSFGVECAASKCKAITEQPPASKEAEPLDRDPEGNPGAACTAHADCVTPMDYLARSSCPFTSYCVEGRCAVACPMPDADAGWTRAVRCEEDADCDCGSQTSSEFGSCACVDGACAAIVKE
jgi:hypothetical protein